MKKIIIPILIISLFVLFISCTNSVSDAVKENEERLVGLWIPTGLLKDISIVLF